MRAAGYRLRFYSGATLTAATYGGGKFGDKTYGMQSSDALTTAHHRLVPWPAGALTQPSWRYRQYDTQPAWEAQIIADDGVVSYVGLDQARLLLAQIDKPTNVMEFLLTVLTAPNGDQRLHRDFDVGNLNDAGTYRVAVVLVYTSGRRMTVPSDDRHLFVITPAPVNDFT